MMRSPDEIKKGLDCCADGNIVCAGNCVFDDDVKLGYPDCVKLLMSNALAYIQQLEAQNTELLKEIEELKAGKARAEASCTQMAGTIRNLRKQLAPEPPKEE